MKVKILYVNKKIFEYNSHHKNELDACNDAAITAMRNGIFGKIYRFEVLEC